MSHPITPPPELVEQWSRAALGAKHWLGGYDLELIATQAARWGADMELEACCEYMQREDFHGFAKELRFARRPKPPSLAEQALELINKIQGDKKMWQLNELDVVRTALERLQELENNG